MNRLRYIYICFAGFFSIISAQAEKADSTIIKRDVTIEKEYNMTIQSVKKESELPPIFEPELKKIEVDYSDFSTVMEPSYEIRNLEAAELKLPEKVQRKEGYIRLGAGNYIGTLADFMYPLVKHPLYRLDIDAHHKGTFSTRMHHTNDVGLAFRRYLKKGKIFADVEYGFEGFNYYGKNKLENTVLYQTEGVDVLGNDFFRRNAGISAWDFGVGYKSFPSKIEKNLFSMWLDYDGFLPNRGLTEHVINTNALYERKMDDNKAGLSISLHNLMYNTDDLDYGYQSSYTIFRMNPYYDYIRERFSLHLGAKLNFSGGSGRSFAPTADISTQITLAEKIWYFYGGITGDLQANTMKNILETNKYIDLNAKIKDSYTPFDIYGGFKFKLIYNLLTDLSVRYKVIKDQHFFVNKTMTNTADNSSMYANVFDAVYSDANLFTVGLKFDYNYNHLFSFVLGGKYNSWNVDDLKEAWQLPKFEMDFGVDLKLTKRTAVNLYSHIATGRKYQTLDGSYKSLKAVTDINLGFFYAHNSKLSAFLKLNNILHQHYEQWYGYSVNGFNGMIGITYSF